MGKRVTKIGISTTSGFGLSAFSKDELDSIHYATLQVLQESGVKVASEEALEIFHGGGAEVERYQGYGIVRLPPYLVEECVASAPHVIVYHGRDPKDDFVAEPNRVGFTTFGGCINIVDIDTRDVRRSSKQDLTDFTRVVDALDEITVVERTLNAADIPEKVLPLHNLEAILASTSKPIFLGGTDDKRGIEVMAEMAAACVGGRDKLKRRPFLNLNVCPLSPLILPPDCCEAIIAAARLGLGILVLPMALSGGTSAVTLAGTMVTHNAEVLAGICLAQLVHKGARCTYGCTSTILDLRFGTSAIGSPEYGMINAAMAKLAQYYRLPSWVGGGCTDSKVVDPQAAYEGTLSATLSALAGANTVFGVGVLDQGMTMDYAKLVLDAEMIRTVQKAVSGIAITDENLAMEVIHEVGPGGAYISHESSLLRMRGQSQTRLFDRRTRTEWLEMPGSKDIVERAYEAAREILQTHEPKPLPEGAADTIRALVEDYEEEVGVKARR